MGVRFPAADFTEYPLDVYFTMDKPAGCGGREGGRKGRTWLLNALRSMKGHLTYG